MISRRCSFHEDYSSEYPAHPGREFNGRDRVRANWSVIFAEVPDFSARLVSCTEDGDHEWAEWRWTGTRTDAEVLDMAGVVVSGVRDGRIAWARLYLESVTSAD